MTRLAPADIGLAFHSQIVDHLTANVSTLLLAEGIDHALLKGPSFARWLYDKDELRGYGDSDFLISRSNWERVVALLQSWGFRDAMAEIGHPRMESYMSYPWESTAGDIDLHATLHGLHADMETVWNVLSANRETLEIEGRPVPILSVPARLMHIALHAANHQHGQAVTDLRRAIQRIPEEDWEHASRLAARLGGTAAFANGLARVDEGKALAKRLGLDQVASVETLLREGQVPLSEALYELSRTPGLRARAGLIKREVVPTPSFMRWWSPLARRGRLGLAISYVWRPVYLLVRLAPAYRAYKRAKREAGAPA
jgi:hypothetical protein